MNTPHRPLTADELDELLSAELDNEFDRAATELGLTPVEARAAVDAAPTATTRRAELARARDALATKPELAPTDESRLIAAALAGHAAAPASLAQHRVKKRRSERAWGVLVAVGSVAAVIVIIVALGVSNPGSSSKSSSADSAGAESAATVPRAVLARPTASVEFGDVSQAVVLRTKVQTVLHARYSTTKSRPAPATTGFGALAPGGLPGVQGPTAAQDTTVPTASADGDQGLPGAPTGAQGLIGQDGNAVVGLPSDNQTGGNRAASGSVAPVSPLTQQICVASAARAAQVRAAPAITGNGSYNGRPVVVVVFRQGPGYTAYVMSTPACSVVAKQKLP